MRSESVLFIGDTSDWSQSAAIRLARYYPRLKRIFWDYGNSRPKNLDQLRGDWIFSFKSDLILSEKILRQFAKGAINFHPAPPTYRGIGGYHYAIANGDPSYGVTCHHMDARIDHGNIIKTLSFDIRSIQSAERLKTLTASHCLNLFEEILALIVQNKPIPHSQETWSRRLYTREYLARFLKRQQPLTIPS